MVLVDSSIWIEALRRNGDLEAKVALEALLEEYEATLCSPVRLEVLGGARQQERAALTRWFSIVPYDALPERTWDGALQLCWKLRDAGLTAPWNDLLVAARAIELGVRVYARDRHFEGITQHAPLRLYKPGYGGTFDPDDE